MGAPVNTLVATLLAAYIVYSATRNQLGRLMQILGLATTGNVEPDGTTSSATYEPK